MSLFAKVMVGLVAFIHMYIFVFEVFLWRTRAPKVFGMTREFAEQTAMLGVNQGFYNGFLAAALVLGLVLPDPTMARAFALFGLSCVAVAGVVGALTASRAILVIQTVPAVIGLVACLLR